MSKQQIGVVGMAVMGRNLALNIESRGYYRLRFQPLP
ncbi:6-phosphogluconate dehydrogenase [Citrobacter koseri]|uniref:6-phosphogluconate dehydrogenase n=1 Tax=Citrobacter koseri TaxID=545 RepID=A0A2X2VLD3_CITKO|nr:6-phosphogluconate dehydrogenase [Citrobacter koseri]